jgi:hypothetical protein
MTAVLLRANMDRRRNSRVFAHLPVRVWGMDAQGLPFMQLAGVRNISHSGALIQGMRRRVLPGEVLDVQMGQEKAQFRVAWVGERGTGEEGEIGIESLPSEPFIWDMKVNLCHCSQFAGSG